MNCLNQILFNATDNGSKRKYNYGTPNELLWELIIFIDGDQLLWVTLIFAHNMFFMHFIAIFFTSLWKYDSFT